MSGVKEALCRADKAKKGQKGSGKKASKGDAPMYWKTKDK